MGCGRCGGGSSRALGASGEAGGGGGHVLAGVGRGLDHCRGFGKTKFHLELVKGLNSWAFCFLFVALSK